MVKNEIDFRVTHVIGFAYGAIISYMLTQFIKAVTDDIAKPLLENGTLGKSRIIKICNKDIELRKVIVSFFQLVLVIALVSIFIDLGIKPQGKIF